MADTLIAQLAREPVPGRVKTRLLPALSPRQAADLHAAMTRHICRLLCDSGVGDLELWVDGDPGARLFRECSELGVAAVKRQVAGDLGERMAAISTHGLSRYRKVLLVGSDVPGLSGDYVAQACAALDRSPVVLGPAEDGGYVLLGLSAPAPWLFESIPWGSADVLRLTIERVEAAGFAYRLLEPLPDIDRPEDLRLLPTVLQALLPPGVG